MNRQIVDVVEGRRQWAVLTARWQSVLLAEPLVREHSMGRLHCDRPFEVPALVADHVITDPPYSERVHSKSRAGAQKEPLKDGNGRMSRCAFKRERDFHFAHITQNEREQMADWIEDHCRRWTLIYTDIESARDWSGAFTRFEYVRTLAMIKVGGTPQFTGDRPGVGFEGIVVMHPRGRKRWNGGGKVGVYRALTVIDRGGQKLVNNARTNEAQKDLAHMCEIVADFTSPGDLVVDLTCGSGTTGVACVRLGRRFIGFEMRSEQAMAARERLVAEENVTTPKAVRAGQESLFRKVG